MTVEFSEIVIDATDPAQVQVRGSFHVHKWHATFNEVVELSGASAVMESSVGSLVQKAWRQHLQRNAESGG